MIFSALQIALGLGLAGLVIGWDCNRSGVRRDFADVFGIVFFLACAVVLVIGGAS